MSISVSLVRLQPRPRCRCRCRVPAWRAAGSLPGSPFCVPPCCHHCSASVFTTARSLGLPWADNQWSRCWQVWSVCRRTPSLTTRCSSLFWLWLWYWLCPSSSTSPLPSSTSLLSATARFSIVFAAILLPAAPLTATPKPACVPLPLSPSTHCLVLPLSLVKGAQKGPTKLAK